MTLNEGIRTTPADTCFLCGEAGTLLYRGLRDRLFDAPGEWSVARCQACRLVWLAPQPAAEDIPKLYQTYYTHAGAPQPGLAEARHWVREAVLAAVFGYRRARGGLSRTAGRVLSIVPAIRDRVGMAVADLDAHASGGRLLDVGSGDGEFLARMRGLGWQVEGVEPDVEAVRTSRERLSLSVRAGTLADVEFAEGSFDAVVLNHVIEHVRDPVDLVARAWRLVRPGGRLAIITPNVESLAHAWHRDAWYCLDPPRHLFLFSHDTLSEVVQRAGVTGVTIRSSSRLAARTWSAGHMIASTGKGPPCRTPTRWARVQARVFQLVEDTFHLASPRAGEELLLIARKS
jgi:SAM-dependent methyltransferase